MICRQHREARARPQQREQQRKGVLICEEAGGVGELIHNGTMPSEGPRKDLGGSQQKDGSSES